MTPQDRQEIIDRFHLVFYLAMFSEPEETKVKVHWLGARARKSPFDLWIYQEILFEMRPDVIVECGTASGGSAYFLASMCELLDSGRVVTIDIRPRPNLPSHPRLTYLSGSSVDPQIVDSVRASIGDADSVMVILDSNHQRDHVLAEMRAYSPMVSNGHYLIVEDSNLGGNPIAGKFGPGPMEAIQEFLAEDDAFVVDRSREKFLVTFNPSGYLKRVR